MENYEKKNGGEFRSQHNSAPVIFRASPLTGFNNDGGDVK